MSIGTFGINWVTTILDEKNVGIFEGRILRKIFDPKRNNEG